ASPLRYALTIKPTVYVSHIRQFWSTARIETTDEGTKILATLDGIVRTISESSLRRNLKLRDKERISSLPDAELFENLTLMGYNISPNQKFTFQKGFNEFSSNITTALVCLATNRTYNFSKMIFDGLVKNINNKGEGSGTPTKPHHTPSPEAQTPSHTTQPTSTLSPVSTTSIPTVTHTKTTPIWQYTQRARIAHLQRQHSELLAKFQPQEVEILKLKERVKVLEDREGIAATRPGNDAPIKGRSMDEGEAATERISDDTEEMAMVLTSIDAATVLAGGIDDVPTGSGFIPTAGPPAAEIPTGSDVVPTASLVFATATMVTPYSKRNGKKVMVECDTPKKQRLQEQIDAQVARELEEQQEREDKRMSEQIARDAEVKDFKGMTFEEVEAKFNSVYKQMEDFIPMGSKEEAERYKRKGIRFDQESSKKLKLSEEVIEEAKFIKRDRRATGRSSGWEEAQPVIIKEYLSIRPASRDKEMELWVELKRLYEPNPEDQLWAQTQNFMHASIEWKLYELCGVHQVTAKDKEIFMLVEKDYLPRKGLALAMICYKLQLKNFSHMANDLVLKIYKIANSPRHQEQLPTASEVGSHWLKKCEATAKKIALLC
nr:hypothetical protein [Tanacetum cinerariifolium]